MKHLIRFASIALVCGLLACLTGCSCSSTRQEAQKEPVPTEKSISAEEAYPTEDANRVGAEGSHLFSFKGMAAGDGTIALSYERSWEQTDDDKKIVLQVKTGQNGAIESVSVG